MLYESALTALAEPTRRALYQRLRRRPYAVGELARAAGISQPAVSQHLRVLRQARLVSAQRDGTKCYYRARAEGLGALRTYLESLWDDVLSAYSQSDPR